MSFDHAATSTTELPTQRSAQLAPQRSALPWHGLTIVSLIVAIGAVAVALVALNKKTPSAAHVAGAVTSVHYNATVANLNSEISRLSGRLTAAEALARSEQPTLATVTKLQTCVPELDALITGQNIETSTRTIGGETYVTSAFLHNGTQISTYCQSTLTKEAGRGAP